jgi:SAM-dependent methyltransferase
MVRRENVHTIRSECPCCKSKGASLLWAVSCDEAAQHFILKEVDSKKHCELSAHIQKLWRQDGKSNRGIGPQTCNVVRCCNCDFCYSDPFVAGDAKFYNLAYSQHDGSYPQNKWEFQITLETLKAKAKKEAVILEVGAGDGAFARMAAAEVTRIENIVCTEYSEYGQLRLKERGIRCIPDDVRNLQGPEYEGAFDCICMFQVLEHLDNLEDLFLHLRWMLKMGGDIFIAVPSEKRIEFNEKNGALLDMPPNHVGRWNRDAFVAIAARCGLTLKRHENEPISAGAAIKQLLICRYLRNAQITESIANRFSLIPNRIFRRLAQAGYLLLDGVTSVPVLFRCVAVGVGNSQWVQISKSTHTA